MPKIKNWILKFCYKIHEKLRLQRINSSPSHKINMGRTISKGFIWIFRRKNKKKNKFVLTYMSCFVMRDFKIPHKQID